MRFLSRFLSLSIFIVLIGIVPGTQHTASAAPALLPPLQTGGCTPQNKFPASGTVDGGGGWSIDYAVEGLAVDEFRDWTRAIWGYPTGDKVTITFTFHAPYSIQESWASDARVVLDGKEIDYMRAPDKNGEPGWSYTSKPLVIPITEEIRRNGFHAIGYTGYARSSSSTTGWVDVVMRGCSQPVSAPIEPLPAQPDAGGPVTGGEADSPFSFITSIIPNPPGWLIPAVGTVAGALGLGIVGIIIRVLTAGKKTPPRAPTRLPAKDTPPQEPAKEENDQLIGYQLQVTPEQIKVSLSQPAAITAVVTAIYSRTGARAAPDAVITLSLPPRAAALQVIPPSGAGQVTPTVNQTGAMDLTQTAVIVRAAASGWQDEKRVLVNIEQSYQLEFY